MAKIFLITGGARSGKSRYALSLAEKYERRVFLATAEIFDEEMRERIELHRRERSGFQTVEEPLHLAAALKEYAADGTCILVDCLTIWLGNLFHFESQTKTVLSDELSATQAEITKFHQILKEIPGAIILVTNEVGMGIVPDNPLARHFRDTAGRLNQDIAAIADRVYFVVSGIAMKIKGEI